MAGLVIVFIVMILLGREDLRDRLLRLAGRSDLHRTTVAMDDAAQRMSRYLSRQLIVNACCGLPIGFGLALIGIPNAAVWGIFAAMLRLLPYLGIVIAAGFLWHSLWRWIRAGCCWFGWSCYSSGSNSSCPTCFSLGFTGPAPAYRRSR
jgi:predicted PurR-regulated permease PerM